MINLQKTISEQQIFVGVHLSGPNTPKTAMFVLKVQQLSQPIASFKVYEKIGPKGSLFSDDRVMQILNGEPNLTLVALDQPLSTPPCVRCQRPTCPSVVRCDDVAVASMMSLAQKFTKSKKKNTINPQIHRYWDILEWSQRLQKGASRLTPTYQPHLMPLVSRSIVLQKRIKALDAKIEIIETSVPRTLEIMAPHWGIEQKSAQEIGSFESGKKIRRDFARHISFEIDGFNDTDRNDFIYIAGESLEVFQALVCAYIASRYALKATDPPPTFMPLEEGWVTLPKRKTNSNEFKS